MAIIKPRRITISNYSEQDDTNSYLNQYDVSGCLNKNNLDSAGRVCTKDITENWGEFENIEDLKKALNELFIRFNTSPKVYIKYDYLLLLLLLYKGLVYGFDHPIDLGENILDVANINNKVLDFKHPVAKKNSQISELYKDETIPTVGYLNNFKLLWEEF